MNLFGIFLNLVKQQKDHQPHVPKLEIKYDGASCTNATHNNMGE